MEIKTSNAYDIPANSGTLTISRATSGEVTVTTKDDDANAATTYRAGGTGALTLGASTGTTAITSSGWAISSSGAVSGVTTVAASGDISGSKKVASKDSLCIGRFNLQIINDTLCVVKIGGTAIRLFPHRTIF
jgi:hypothetical protein